MDNFEPTKKVLDIRLSSSLQAGGGKFKTMIKWDIYSIQEMQPKGAKMPIELLIEATGVEYANLPILSCHVECVTLMSRAGK